MCKNFKKKLVSVDENSNFEKNVLLIICLPRRRATVTESSGRENKDQFSIFGIRESWCHGNVVIWLL